MTKKPDNISDYRWNYGKLGEALVEDEIRANRGEWFRKGLQLKRGWTLLEGHEPEIEFTNLSHIPVKHVDIIMTVKNEIRAIVEVKTTTSASKREFDAHGACARVLYEAHKARIPIYLSVVRLTKKPPESIATAFEDYLDHLRGNGTEYLIEHYNSREFFARGRYFVLR